MPLWKNVNGIFAHHCLFTKTMLLEVIPGDSSDPTSFANEKPTHLLLLEDFCIIGFVASRVPPYETRSKITWANECRWFKFPFVRKRADDWISLVYVRYVFPHLSIYLLAEEDAVEAFAKFDMKSVAPFLDESISIICPFLGAIENWIFSRV